MSDFPTKPGAYYWRESDEDALELVTLCAYCVGIGRLWCPTKHAFHDDMRGQWLQFPTADELLELQSAKKMVDEGVEAWAVFTQITHEMVVSWQDKGESQEMCDNMNRMSSKHRYTCEPVTIVRKAKR